jgi:hypothetical protein
MVTMTKEYNRQYYHNNRDKFLTKYNHTHYCEVCNTLLQKKYRNRHEATAKHHKKVNQSTGPPASQQVSTIRQEIKSLLATIATLEKE